MFLNSERLYKYLPLHACRFFVQLLCSKQILYFCSNAVQSVIAINFMKYIQVFITNISLCRFDYSLLKCKYGCYICLVDMVCFIL